MAQSINFTFNKETEQFHLHLDNEDMGPVDTEQLREESSSLYLHFHLFREPPAPENTNETEPTLSDEEVDELIREAEIDEEEILEELDNQDE